MPSSAVSEDDMHEATRTQAEDALTFQEVSHLNDRKVTLRDSYSVYLREHQSLRKLFADFLANVLIEKPSNIFPFATEYFAALETSVMTGPPMLVRGQPALVITGAKQLPLLDILNQRLPCTFLAPIMTTTRPPRHGERPGITIIFTTIDNISTDIEVGKYLEFGKINESGCEGELIGTTLDAITRIMVAGAVPLLHVPYDRAVAACKCRQFNPSPCTVLIREKAEPHGNNDAGFNEIINDDKVDIIIDALVAIVEKVYPGRVPGVFSAPPRRALAAPAV